MITLLDHLRALFGGSTLTKEIDMLTAADSTAARLPREHGVLYGDAIQEAIDHIADEGPCIGDVAKAGYYLGLHVGWRTAQRLR